MDKEQKLRELKDTVAVLNKTRHDIFSSRRDIGYSISDERIMYRTQSVLSRTEDDIDGIISYVNSLIDELENT